MSKVKWRRWRGQGFPEQASLQMNAVFADVFHSGEIPPLRFKPEWDVRILPPFGGTMMRFFVDCNGRHVSVFCDFFSKVSLSDEPYWEMYPRHYRDADGRLVTDYVQFPIADTEGLMRCVEAELNGEEGQA